MSALYIAALPKGYTHMVSTTLSRETATGHEYEVEVTVLGTVEPYVAGRYSGRPEDCYPEEGGYATDVTAYLNRHGCWVEVELTEAEAEVLAEELSEQALADAEPDYEDEDEDEPDYDDSDYAD